MITTKDIGKNNKQRSEEYEKIWILTPKAVLPWKNSPGLQRSLSFRNFISVSFFSNLSSLVKNQADEEIQSTYKRTNQYRYQANRSFIIGHLKSLFPKILCCLLELSAIDHLYKEALRCKSQIIPERSFPRKKNKAIGRTHFRNKKVSF